MPTLEQLADLPKIEQITPEPGVDMLNPERIADMHAQAGPEQMGDMHEQAARVSAVLETALAKPRLDMAAMREQIICMLSRPTFDTTQPS